MSEELLNEGETEDLRHLFEDLVAITYPPRILRRRLGLLTKTEARRVRSLYFKVLKMKSEIERLLEEEIDLIICKRASKENDPWR